MIQAETGSKTESMPLSSVHSVQNGYHIHIPVKSIPSIPHSTIADEISDVLGDEQSDSDCNIMVTNENDDTPTKEGLFSIPENETESEFDDELNYLI